MDDKLPHELSIEELKELGEQKRKMYCLAVSKMNKDELIKYIYGKDFIKTEFGKKFLEDNYKKLKVGELKKNAGVLKKQSCVHVQKMTRKELLKYIYGINVSEKTSINKKKRTKKKVTKKEKSSSVEEISNRLCEELATIKHDENEIVKKRKEIYNVLKRKVKGDLTSGSFDIRLPNKLFTEMLELYDKKFFDNKIKKLSKEKNCRWIICWNDMCIGEAGGLCQAYADKDTNENKCLTIKIQLNRDIFKKSLRLLKRNQKLWNDGLVCDNLLSCVQITFEHELIHGIMNCACPKYFYGRVKEQVGNWKGKSGSIQSGHGKTFMSIVNNLYGHTNWTHALTIDQKDMESYQNKVNNGIKIKETLKVGDLIKINDRNNDELILKVLKKNPVNAKAINEKNNQIWKVPYLLIIDIVDKKESDKKNKNIRQKGGGGVMLDWNNIDKYLRDIKMLPNDCCFCVFNYLGVIDDEEKEMASVLYNIGLTSDEILSYFLESRGVLISKVINLNNISVRSMSSNNKTVIDGEVELQKIISLFDEIEDGYGYISSYGFNVGGHCVVFAKSPGGIPLMIDVQERDIFYHYSQIINQLKKESKSRMNYVENYKNHVILEVYKYYDQKNREIKLRQPDYQGLANEEDRIYPNDAETSKFKLWTGKDLESESDYEDAIEGELPSRHRSSPSKFNKWKYPLEYYSL